MSDPDSDLLDTLPPGPPPGLYTDEVVNDLLATAKRLEKHYKELLDPEGLLEKNVRTISGLIDTNYRLIHNEVVGIRGTLDALAPRVTKAEQRLDVLDGLRQEFDEMKIRMAHIETALNLKGVTT